MFFSINFLQIRPHFKPTYSQMPFMKPEIKHKFQTFHFNFTVTCASAKLCYASQTHNPWTVGAPSGLFPATPRMFLRKTAKVLVMRLVKRQIYNKDAICPSSVCILLFNIYGNTQTQGGQRLDHPLLVRKGCWKTFCSSQGTIWNVPVWDSDLNQVSKPKE